MSEIDPAEDHPTRVALARALQARRREEALESAQTLVQSFPRSPIAWSGLADAWRLAGKPAVAVDARRQAAALRPDVPILQYNLGTALLEAGDRIGAVAVLTALNQKVPGQPRLLMNLGIARRDLGQLGPAAEALSQARRCAPDGSPLAAEVDWNRSLVLLMGGDLRSGLPAYEARRQLPHFSLPITHGRPDWTGAPLEGTLLVVVEQGLGDTLQYARWIRRARKRVGRILFAVQKPLVPLLRAGLDGLEPGDEVVALASSLDGSGVKAVAPLLSLPHLLGAHDRRSHMESTPWLQPDPALVAHWTERLASLPGTFRIGIVWQGNPAYKDDANRSVPLRHYAPLAAIPGVTLVSLQKRHGRKQLQQLPEGMQVVDLHDELDEHTGPFLDTAAAMHALDLVVTSDTATLHLAGALGVHTRAAIAHIPDWRFGLRGDQLPEYPKTRLVRQPRPGAWEPVMQHIASEVQRMVTA